MVMVIKVKIAVVMVFVVVVVVANGCCGYDSSGCTNGRGCSSGCRG